MRVSMERYIARKEQETALLKASFYEAQLGKAQAFMQQTTALATTIKENPEFARYAQKVFEDKYKGVTDGNETSEKKNLSLFLDSHPAIKSMVADLFYRLPQSEMLWQETLRTLKNNPAAASQMADDMRASYRTLYNAIPDIMSWDNKYFKNLVKQAFTNLQSLIMPFVKSQSTPAPASSA